MKNNYPIIITNMIILINSLQLLKFRLIFILISGVLLLPLQQTRSEELFLKCTGKYEINRGALIKPDWETSYITINLDGLISIIDAGGLKKEGRTKLRRNSYTITHRDIKKKVKHIYKINETHGIYTFKNPQKKRTLIGTCQKGRG